MACLTHHPQSAKCGRHRSAAHCGQWAEAPSRAEEPGQRTVHPFQPNGLLAGVGDIEERFLGGSRRTIDAILGRLEVDIHRIAGRECLEAFLEAVVPCHGFFCPTKYRRLGSVKASQMGRVRLTVLRMSISPRATPKNFFTSLANRGSYCCFPHGYRRGCVQNHFPDWYQTTTARLRQSTRGDCDRRTCLSITPPSRQRCKRLPVAHQKWGRFRISP